MHRKIRKLLHEVKGFTLIELMTVMIILGIVLAIGVPNYLKIQSKAEYDADKAVVNGLAKTVEMYAVRKNDYSDKTISYLTTNNIIDHVVLKRKNEDGASNKSVPNNGKTISQVAGSVSFKFDVNIGCVTEQSIKDVIRVLIGDSPY